MYRLVGILYACCHIHKQRFQNWRIHATLIIIIIVVVIIIIISCARVCILLIYEHLVNGKHYGAKPISTKIDR